MTDLQLLHSELHNRGITTDIETALDGGSQLAVVISPGGELKRAFSVAPRPEGVFILGFRGCFRLDDSANPAELISRLSVQVVNQGDAVPDLKTFSLQPYSYRKWLDDGWQRVLEEQKAAGWSQITDEENEQLWETFTTRFSFRRSMSPEGWPAIKEPSPSMTWSVQAIRKTYESDSELFNCIEHRSREQLLLALDRLGAGVGRMYALHLNHAGYSFEPTTVARRGLCLWPVPIIPVHNYSLFIDPTFLVGILGHPWEASICVFGELLIKELTHSPLGLLWRGDPVVNPL